MVKGGHGSGVQDHVGVEYKNVRTVRVCVFVNITPVRTTRMHQNVTGGCTFEGKAT